MLKYSYQGKTLSEDELRRRFYYVSFPQVIKADELPAGVTQVEVPDPEPVAPTLGELKAAKAEEVRGVSNMLRNQLQTGYSQGEVDTFAEQYAGAKAILSGGGDLFVTGLLSNRLGRVPTQTELTEFATLIVANYERVKNAIVTIIGTQQRLELAIRAATTAEEVGAIAWPSAS